MKNGQVTTDAAKAHMNKMLPNDIRDRVIAAIEKCRSAADGEQMV
jgi:hypothetical protein